MPKFRVVMSADARVDAIEYVEAASAEEAEQKAIARAKSGDVSWRYQGADDDTVEAEAEEVSHEAF